jgi:hypothetical protein
VLTVSGSGGQAAEFRLSGWRHFRVPRRLALLAAFLAAASWFADVAASRQGSGYAVLAGAVALGVILGLALAALIISTTHVTRDWVTAARGQRPAMFLTADRAGVTLHELGARLAWHEVIEVRTGQRGHAMRFLPAAWPFPPGRLVFCVADPVTKIIRASAGSQSAAKRAFLGYGSPFVADPVCAAAPAGAVAQAIAQFARCPVVPGRMPASVPASAAPGPRMGPRPSALQWALLVPALFAIGAGIWGQTRPFHDRWLMEHGRRAAAVVVAVTTPCVGRDVPAWEISFTGPAGTREFENTSSMWGCPQPGSALTVLYDPNNPANVGDIRTLRTTPLGLLLLAGLLTAMVLGATWLVQFWRDPLIRRH